MKLTIKNNDELTSWMNARMLLDHDLIGIPGQPPIGATYSDGVTVIVHPVNVAWVDSVTGERFDIEYEKDNK